MKIYLVQYSSGDRRWLNDKAFVSKRNAEDRIEYLRTFGDSELSYITETIELVGEGER